MQSREEQFARNDRLIAHLDPEQRSAAADLSLRLVLFLRANRPPPGPDGRNEALIIEAALALSLEMFQRHFAEKLR